MRRALVHRVLAGAAAVGALASVVALAADPAPTSPPPAIAAAVAAGRHIRIAGPHGPVHVFVPAGYRAETGATIVYVHGYFADVDTAWTTHRLAEQFALSSVNALFIAPEAPTKPKVPVEYPDLGEVIRLAEDHAGVARGALLTAAIAHSGGNRTVAAWLDEPLLDHVTLVDGMYNDDEPFAAWLRASPRRRMITLGEDTILGTEAFAARFPAETVTLNRVPPAYDLWPAAARTAKHLYVRAQYAHMPLVTDGIVLPSLLRLLPVPRLPTPAWNLPLGSLPPPPDAS